MFFLQILLSMYKIYGVIIAVLCLCSPAFGADAIRVNQMGYLPEGLKTAVFLSDERILLKNFVLVDNLSGKTIFKGVRSEERRVGKEC